MFHHWIATFAQLVSAIRWHFWFRREPWLNFCSVYHFLSNFRTVGRKVTETLNCTVRPMTTVLTTCASFRWNFRLTTICCSLLLKKNLAVPIILKVIVKNCCNVTEVSMLWEYVWVLHCQFHACLCMVGGCVLKIVCIFAFLHSCLSNSFVMLPGITAKFAY